MDPIEIKIAMLRANVTQTAISEILCISQSMVSQVIKGDVVSERVRNAIASAIDVPVRQIWPDPPGRPGRKKTSLSAECVLSG